MLPISPKEPTRFTPEHLKDGDAPPVFLLKVPSLRDSIDLDAALAAEGVRYPGNAELAAALRDGVALHVVEEDRAALVEIVDAFETATADGERAMPELAEQIDEMIKALRAHHRPLAMIEAERGRFLAMAMLVRAELFLVGIEGADVPKLERRAGRLSDSCQAAIEERYGRGTLFAIGARTVELASPSPDERKNSESPPPSPPDPAISTAASGPPTGRPGKSSANGSSAIPA